MAIGRADAQGRIEPDPAEPVVIGFRPGVKRRRVIVVGSKISGDVARRNVERPRCTDKRMGKCHGIGGGSLCCLAGRLGGLFFVPAVTLALALRLRAGGLHRFFRSVLVVLAK